MPIKHQSKQKNNKLLLDITKFKFLRDLLLVQALRPDTNSALIDPTQYDDKPEFGEIVRLGDGVKDLKVGDIIRFGKYSTEAIRTNGKDYFIVHEEDVSAVYDSKKN